MKEIFSLYGHQTLQDYGEVVKDGLNYKNVRCGVYT